MSVSLTARGRGKEAVSPNEPEKATNRRSYTSPRRGEV